MFQFPLATWNAIRRGSFHVYGHIHNDREEVFQEKGKGIREQKWERARQILTKANV